MRIESVRVWNYKSYHEPAEFKLTEGFNCIVGQNDVGKTALLEAIGLRLGNNPHKSIASSPERDMVSDPNSRVQIEFSLSRSEVISAIRRVRSFGVPVGPGEDQVKSRSIAQMFIDNVRDENIFRAIYQTGRFWGGKLNEFESLSNAPNYQSVHWNGQELVVENMTMSGADDQYFPGAIGFYLRSRIFLFQAERLKIGRSPSGAGTALSSNASNLPEVLNTLQSNPPRFNRLNGYIRTIFPHIDKVSVRVVSGTSDVEIILWPHGIGERDDLAILLAESGTGLSQVLAILAVIMVAEHPQTIIIDEPQSFLHPGAARKLMEILREHQQHQFIVATHSPTIIAAAEPNNIVLIRKQGPESIPARISSDTRSNLEELLSAVGARLSDVYGADTILWVEGETEELCFPLLIRNTAGMSLLGTVILRLTSTGGVEGRHAKLVFDLHRRLSGSAGLLPPSIGFILDREMRTERQRTELSKRSGAAVYFLSRRTYENYLIHPTAIAEVLSNHLEAPISSVTVSEWLETHRLRSAWCKNIEAALLEAESWVVEVDAARLLASMFDELSGHTVEYRKTRHSVAITEWLLQHEPEQLAEIVEILDRALHTRGQPT
jgi:energy-coupling factor transporter ATP-binding protein EcfA2